MPCSRCAETASAVARKASVVRNFAGRGRGPATAVSPAVRPGPAVITSLGGTQVFVDHQGVGDRFTIDGGAGNDSATASGTGGDDVIGLAFDGTGIAVFANGGQAISVTNVDPAVVNARCAAAEPEPHVFFATTYQL